MVLTFTESFSWLIILRKKTLLVGLAVAHEIEELMYQWDVWCWISSFSGLSENYLWTRYWALSFSRCVHWSVTVRNVLAQEKKWINVWVKHAGQGVWVLKQVFFKRFVETSIFTIHTTFGANLYWSEESTELKKTFVVCLWVVVVVFFNLIYVSRDKHLWLQVFY